VLANAKEKAVVAGVVMVVERWKLARLGGARMRYLLVAQASLGAWPLSGDCT
jgi:hypothetical protein